MSKDVVLATRFGAASEAPAREAARLARFTGGDITVVYVAVELSALTAAAGEAGLDTAAERARELDAINEQLRDFTGTYFSDMQVRVHIAEGPVAESVTNIAAGIGAAYLVVGTRGRSSLARLVLGDTTQSILQHAPCPVLVVPLGDH